MIVIHGCLIFEYKTTTEWLVEMREFILHKYGWSMDEVKSGALEELSELSRERQHGPRHW